jgi:protein-tyrosine-phosphatase
MQLHSAVYERAMGRVLQTLTERYRDGFSPDEVAQVVARGRQQLESSGRHPEFMPALLEHWARDQLLAAARAEGRPLSPLPKVLFVCEHNEARSQMAAALADHLSGGRVLVRSAGVHPTGVLSPCATQAMAERGVDLSHPVPSPVNEDAVDAADVVVLIGCLTTPVAGRRTVRWDVPDPRDQGLDAARQVADSLDALVRELLAELEVLTPDRTRPLAEAAAG